VLVRCGCVSDTGLCVPCCVCCRRRRGPLGATSTLEAEPAAADGEHERATRAGAHRRGATHDNTAGRCRPSTCCDVRSSSSLWLVASFDAEPVDVLVPEHVVAPGPLCGDDVHRAGGECTAHRRNGAARRSMVCLGVGVEQPRRLRPRRRAQRNVPWAPHRSAVRYLSHRTIAALAGKRGSPVTRQLYCRPGPSFCAAPEGSSKARSASLTGLGL